MNDGASKLRSINETDSAAPTTTATTSTTTTTTTTTLNASSNLLPIEDEPQLKYQRLGGSVSEILKRDVASCLVVHPRFLTLGTHSGMLFVLDFEGNEIKRFSKHTVTINAISVEPSGEFIATAGDDGRVVILSLYSDDVVEFSYSRPILAIQLDPEYVHKKSRPFCYGGREGKLILNSKGFFGSKDNVLHSGEGAIHSIAWRAKLIAWANDIGVKIYDTETNQRITYISRNARAPRADLYRVSLRWISSDALLIGWADSVKVARVRLRSSAPPNSGAAASEGLPQKYVEIIANFETDFWICGLAPFRSHLVALAYIDDDEEPVESTLSVTNAVANSSTTTMTEGGGGSLRPELRVMTLANDELSSDALTLQGHKQYRAADYSLQFLPAHSSGESNCDVSAMLSAALASARGAKPTWQYFGARKTDGSSSGGGATSASNSGGGSATTTATASNGSIDESHDHQDNDALFFVLCPKDLIVARARDLDDHVDWLLAAQRYEAALLAVDESCMRRHSIANVGAQYIEHLLQKGDIQAAAALAPQILRDNVALWEQIVVRFEKLNRLDAIAKYIPLGDFRPKEAVATTSGEGATSSMSGGTGGDATSSTMASMAPVIPIGSDGAPITYNSSSVCQLGNFVYELILNDFLINDPVKFLTTIESWPSSIYNINTIITSLKERLKNHQIEQLSEALAKLYYYNKEYEKTLHIYLRLRRGDVFGLIKQHNLYGAVRDRVKLLCEFDLTRAIALLVDSVKELPISVVVDQLQTSRNLLHAYLHAIFVRDAHLAKEYHELQISLYADYAPLLLLPFLRQSTYYKLENALAVCTERKLYREKVFILGRMGDTKKALNLIMSEMRDVKQAIDFVVEHSASGSLAAGKGNSSEDDELWEDLIQLSLQSPVYVGQLLEHVGGRVDPLRLIRRVPNGMVIEGLRDRLVKIIADYALQCRLRQGCNQILKADCVTLFQSLYRGHTQAQVVDPKLTKCTTCSIAIDNVTMQSKHASSSAVRNQENLDDENATTTTTTTKDSKASATTSTSSSASSSSSSSSSNTSATAATTATSSSVSASESQESKEVVIFWCGHVYHRICLRQQLASSRATNAASKQRLNGGFGGHKEFCPTCKSDKESRRRQKK